MSCHQHTTIRTRHLRAWALGFGALLLVAACGSEVPHDELAAALRADVGTSGDGGSGATGSSAPRTPTAGGGTTTDGGVGGKATTDAGTPGGPGVPTAGGGAGTDGGDSSSCTGSEAPIVIGTVGQQSGIAGAALANGPRAVAAWAESMNAAGGIGCHPVRYLIADDGADPARHRSLVQDLVENKGVVAFVHMNAPLTAPASQDYLRQHGIPIIGTEGGLDYVYQSPFAFPQAASGTALVTSSFFGIAPSLSPEERGGLGILVCLESESCGIFGREGPAVAQEAGLTVVFNGTATLTQPDYTSQCLNARNAGVKVLHVALDPNSLLRLARSCSSVQFRPRYAVTPASINADLLDSGAFEGLVTGFTVRPFVIDDPVLAEFRDVMATYAPGVPLDFAGNLAWASAKLFELGAAQAPDPTTSAGLLQGMQSIQGADLGGLIGAVSFAAGQNAPVSACWWPVIVENGEFVSRDGGKRACR